MARMSLPPGFRFHPTDVELVMYYLKRKSLGKRLRFEAIAEVNFYKYSPWDLPDKSCLKNKDLEWFFFCPISRKYASGSRSGRATETGYWKATGKDRAIMHNEQSVGMIKTLVFHLGHAPKGERTDWVMHEYRILEKGLADTGVEQSAYVLVKLFKKSGLGPKNGAQYGAPFNEEEWAADDDDEIENYAATFQPSATFPSSAIANNNSHSVVTSTYTHGSTSSASLQPLSVIAYNSSYSVDSAPKSASLPLTAVTTSHCNSIGSSSFVPPSDPLLALAHNSNSVTTDTFFHGGTSTGSLPVLGPPTVGSLANEPAGDKDVESLLAMFTEDDFLNMPSELNEIQVNGEEFLELDDIFADLGDLTDWEKLRKRLP